MVLRTGLSLKMLLPLPGFAMRRSLSSPRGRFALGPVVLLGLLPWLKLPCSSMEYEAGSWGKRPREFYFCWRAKMRCGETALLTLFSCRRAALKARSMTKRSSGFTLSW